MQKYMVEPNRQLIADSGDWLRRNVAQSQQFMTGVMQPLYTDPLGDPNSWIRKTTDYTMGATMAGEAAKHHNLDPGALAKVNMAGSQGASGNIVAAQSAANQGLQALTQQGELYSKDALGYGAAYNTGALPVMNSIMQNQAKDISGGVSDIYAGVNDLTGLVRAGGQAIDSLSGMFKSGNGVSGSTYDNNWNTNARDTGTVDKIWAGDGT